MTDSKPWLADQPITYGPWLDNGAWDRQGSCERRWSPEVIAQRVDSGTARPVHYRPPENEWQALMEAPLFAEPERDLVSLGPLREALADAFDALPVADRDVAEAWLIERQTIRGMSRPANMDGMSVGGTWNQLQRVIAELRRLLSDDERVQPFLSNNSTEADK